MLSRDPLTAFRSDIVLLSSASTLSCSTQADLTIHRPPSQQICKRDHRGRGLDNHHQTSCLHRAGQTARNFCRQILPLQQGGGVTIKATIPQAAKRKANEWVHWSPHPRPTWEMPFQYKFHSHLCSLVRNNGSKSHQRGEFDHKPWRKPFDIHNLWPFYCLWILFF